MYNGEIKVNVAYSRSGDDFILVTKRVDKDHYLISDFVFEEDENGDLIPDNNPHFEFKWHLENERLVTESDLRFMILG